ncbi:MAG: MarR family transcriptional regulator [Coprococcus sp.]|nr:MarR family transcriptional regulator [Coprococcus sp.]
MNKKECEKGIGFSIHRLDHGFKKRLSAGVEKAGLDEITLMHGWIIRYLYERRGSDVFQRDIEKNFSIGRSTVTGIIQLMEKKGYLRRESVEQDARLKKVVLTEKGIYAQESIEGIIEELNSQLMRGIGEEELQTFYEVLRKLEANLFENCRCKREDQR